MYFKIWIHLYIYLYSCYIASNLAIDISTQKWTAITNIKKIYNYTFYFDLEKKL